MSIYVKLWSNALSSNTLNVNNVVFKSGGASYRIPEVIRKSVPGRRSSNSLYHRHQSEFVLDSPAGHQTIAGWNADVISYTTDKMCCSVQRTLQLVSCRFRRSSQHHVTVVNSRRHDNLSRVS